MSSATATGTISSTWSSSRRRPSIPQPRRRSPRNSRSINRSLVAEGRNYLLIGFGRWGTSDPPLGVPVAWGQISGARVIVEATLPDVQPDLSQGSHFFHNVLSFQVLYLSVEHHGPYDDRLGVARRASPLLRSSLTPSTCACTAARRQGRRRHRAGSDPTR